MPSIALASFRRAHPGFRPIPHDGPQLKSFPTEGLRVEPKSPCAHGSVLS